LRALWALARLRVFDVLRSLSASLAFLGLPVVILLVLAVVFAKGQPFEERSLSLVGTIDGIEQLALPLASQAGLRLERAGDLDEGRLRLRARATTALLYRADGELVLELGAKEELWGRGVVSLLPGARLHLVPLGSLGYVQFLFPGLLCSSVMFAGMFGMGYAMARYRQNQFLKKLATLPVSRATFVLAQILGRGSLALGQIVLLLLAGWLALGLRPSLSGMAGALLVGTLGLFVFSGIGFLLSALIETEAVVSDVISGLTLPFTLFSGVFFPLEALPGWLAAPCRWLPSTLMLDAARATLLYDVGLLSLGAQLGGLVLWALSVFGLGVKLFRWHR
jgi:ABC-type multidrug transport system permease subunit